MTQTTGILNAGKISVGMVAIEPGWNTAIRSDRLRMCKGGRAQRVFVIVSSSQRHARDVPNAPRPVRAETRRFTIHRPGKGAYSFSGISWPCGWRWDLGAWISWSRGLTYCRMSRVSDFTPVLLPKCRNTDTCRCSNTEEIKGTTIRNHDPVVVCRR
jgi:hypothetical protein